MTEYEELRFRVRPVGVDRHVVTVSGPGGAADVMTVGGQPEAYRERWEQLIESELGHAPTGGEHAAARLRDLGRDVFGLLFGKRAEEYLRAAHAHVRRMQPPRGLRLRFDLPPELRCLPLEALCAPPTEPGQAPALHDGLSLVRSLPGGPLGGRLPEPYEEPSRIRLLVAHASPSGEGQLHAEAEVEALFRELPQVAVEITVVARATRERLELALGDHSDLPTAVLLIAHGSYDGEYGKGVVHLETPGGGTDRVPADLLSGMLLRAPRLRLAVLNLCSGAESSRTEPFSGLAQALIEGGVPAVVAMHGKVSDRSAGLFGPGLLKGIATNQTIDAAMASARRRISYQPGLTAAEWATPVLFLHEECRHGWLFKAREVRDDERAAHDPLRQGAEALQAVRSFTGHVEAAQLIEAARFHRLGRDWQQVLGILGTDTKKFRDEQRLLLAEAAYELVWPKVQELCELLASERAEPAAQALTQIRETLPDEESAWLPVLDKEVRDLGRLSGLLDAAYSAGRNSDWAAALGHCEKILAERPGGFGDTVRLRDTACEELAVAEACASAAAASAAGDWAAASAAYAQALGRRSDHAPALAGTAYAQGRAAEEAGDWPAAATAYGRCPALHDASARAAYARGRAAARTDDWPTAHDAFTKASALYGRGDLSAPDTTPPGVRNDVSAASGRTGMPTSGAASDATGGDTRLGTTDLDVRPHTRAPDAKSHAADGDGRSGETDLDVRPEAMSPDEGPDAAAGGARYDTHFRCPRSLHLPAWSAYAAGRVAEAEQRWGDAAGRFVLADGFPDGALRTQYARGRAATEAGAWPDALAAMEAAAALRGTETDGALPAPADADRHAGSVCATDKPRSALDAPEPGPASLPDLDAWLGVLRQRVHESAVTAAEAGDWNRALESLLLLPDAYEDTLAQRRFAEGRVAEAAGDWAVAAAAYAEAGHTDAPARRHYALGRRCALHEKWDAAKAHFAAVPARIHDFPEPPAGLLLYAQGRAAAARRDWKAVVEDFGGLPDSHADGDVGHRRKYARARLAEQQEEARPDTWTSVLGHLDDVPDEALDGAVGLLRRKAAGLHAQSVGDWERALELYEPFVADEEFARLHRYALARLHERADRWAEALAAYQDLPDTHGDTAPRARYAEARVAEADAVGAGPWRAVREAYEELADAFADDAGFADAALRAQYARARVAEAEGDWEETCRAADTLRAHSDASRLAAYARGRLTESQRDWHRAVEAFRSCAPYRDAGPRLAHCEGRLLEERGRFAAAAEAYERAGAGHEDARAQAVRLRGVLRALPWVDGTVGEPLVADPFALRDTTFPYLALRDAGVGPGTSMDAVGEMSFTLMERDGTSWTWPERMAWDRLRVPARRLELDALLYRWNAPSAVREAVAHLVPDDGPDPLDALCERFPRDAPLLLLLARGREAAVAAWEQRLASAPGDMAVAQGLAVAWLWQAWELEHSGAWEHAVRAWEAALAHWAALLSDEDYWDGWRAERAGCYQRNVTPDELARLRYDLSRHLFERLAAGEQSHTEQGRPEQAEAYRALTALFEAELGGARVLKEVGGLPSVAGTGGALACGPRYLRLLRLETVLAERAAELSVSAQQGQDPGKLVVRQLRWAFSELSHAYALSETHRFEQALDALPEPATLTELPEDCAGPAATADPKEHIRECGHCQDFVRRNPAYLGLRRRRARFVQDRAALAVHARLSLAQAALTSGSGGLDLALAHWTQAVRVSTSAGMAARTKWSVVQMVLGRIEALISTLTEQRGAALDAAVTLIEQVKPVLQPLARDLAGQLDAQLSQALSMRGVWRASSRRRFGLPLDVPAGEADLRQALKLNPESGHARDNLVRVLVFTLDERTADPVEQLLILEEALGLLHTGLRRQLAHRYRETLAETLNALERIVSARIGIGGLADLMRAMAQEQPPDESDLAALARQLADRARRELADGGSVPVALHLLIRAVRADTSAAELRSLLLDVVARLRDTLRGTGEVEEGNRR
ncbi:CHAT domain-containing protein [Streptomyces yerevanensis]|uniref:CHAT domain-containing protein n=1 Tax=Streptomyces yerevanensis TaxID=66378 RepID=UPI0005268D7D|nr:CHAT domain-containing protein [Streptomyces yerevanensis]